MSLYMINFDNEQYYIEAQCMVKAIKAWKRMMGSVNTGVLEIFTDEPEKVFTMSHGGVFRDEDNADETH